MTTTSDPIELRHALRAGGSSVRLSIQRPIDVDAEWLHQARKVRDEALRLLRERFTQDLESAVEILGSRDPEALAAEVEYANRLTADYLAESEKLFALMGRLVQSEKQHTAQKLEYHSDRCTHPSSITTSST